MSHEVSVSEIQAHRGTVQGIANSVGTTAAAAKGTGIGDHSLYGLLGQAILPPMMAPTLTSAGGAISELDSFLGAVVENLQTTIDAYEQTEQDNIDRSDEITQSLQQTGN